MAVATLDAARRRTLTSRRSSPAVVATEVAPLLRRLVSLTSTVFVALAAVAFLALAVGPHVLGYRTATMLTGSMAPLIDPGDVVVMVPEPVADVAVGDIISYHIPVEDHRVETHRVVEVTHDAAGRLAVVTQGDANQGKDPWVATLEGGTVWKTQLVVPHVGSWIRDLRSPVVQGVILWGAIAGTLVLGLRRIWSRPPTDDGA